MDALRADRKTLFTSDTIRTLILVLLSAGTIFMFLRKKLTEKLVMLVFCVLILFDLVGVDRRYVNNDNFVSAIKVKKPYQVNEADKTILNDASHFRVFDVSNEGNRTPARAAYYHNSIGGYHAAKLRRFEELFDFHIMKNNMEVLNMLNTKYVIIDDETGKVSSNTDYTSPNGNAWFINELEVMSSANEEIVALDSLSTKTKAITTMPNVESKHFVVDSTALISLKNYKPNQLDYESTNDNSGLAVLSEVYYAFGWKAYIDGIETRILRVNYTLRGIEIPAGKHDIVF